MMKCMIVVVSSLVVQVVIGFQLPQQHGQQHGVPLWRRGLLRQRDIVAVDLTPTRSGISDIDTTIEKYQYKDWNLTYRCKKSTQRDSNNKRGRSLLKENEKSPETSSMVLIHPVGIGLDSWFWQKLMDEEELASNFDIIAPDLIGCGTLQGGDSWDPTVKPLSFPLGWAEGVEPLLPRNSSATTLICQGGLAPVAVVLASRYPHLISRLILTSPPTYQDMVTAIPQDELKRNFGFLTNPLAAKVAFGLLESEWALRFFSNAFLFSEKCDDLWVSNAMHTISPEQRFPVAAFNAGLCNHRSFMDELTRQIKQPTLILSGVDDKRDRQGYVDNMLNCKWKRLEGCNVLPWENPAGVSRAVLQFCDSTPL